VPGGQVRAEDAVGDRGLEHSHPGLANPLAGDADVAVPRRLPEVLRLVLVDQRGVRVQFDRAQRRVHQAFEGRRHVRRLVQHRAILRLQLLQVGRHEHVDDRVLGLEVVVDASGQDPDGLADLAHRGARDHLAGEQLR
jgi:hypothetical protein